MTIRDDFLRDIVNPLRHLPDMGFGIRQFKITLVRREWQPLGGNPPEVDVGEFVDVETVLSPRFKVRELGGVSTNGQFKVEPITPKNASGGYTPDQLIPPKEDGIEFFWKLEGPFANGEGIQEFDVVSLDTSKPFRYSAILQSRQRRAVT